MGTIQSKTTNREAAGMSLSQGAAPQACCGGAAPSGTNACCALDAEVKSGGGAGCGCGTAAAAPAAKKSACCG